MAEKRFDIGAVSKFQSREGGLDKGGLVRNGFTEKKGTNSVWSWMRPALGTEVSAPGTSTGLGFFRAGTQLFGMVTQGTASSYVPYP